MAKTDKKKNILTTLADIARVAKKFMNEEAEAGRGITIIEAQIKDDFCLYSFEHTSGRQRGFVHKVNIAPGIIDDDLRKAFTKLNVHLAHVDDIFKHSGIDIDSISTMHNHELTLLYHVSHFKIKGGEDNESVILIGNKYLSSSARMDLESPKVAIDTTSSYKWYNELKEAIDNCREEVALYHYGKYTVVENEDEKEDEKQTKMTFVKPAAEEEELVNLEEGKVK